jgi:SOS-response transcriptional repressor LexA
MRKMTPGLNDRHHSILAYLQENLVDKASSPTLREIGKALGIHSVSLVNYYLERLEDDGYIRRTKLSPHKVKITLTAQTTGKNPLAQAGGRAARGDIVIIPVIGVLKDDRFYFYKEGKIASNCGKPPP